MIDKKVAILLFCVLVISSGWIGFLLDGENPDENPGMMIWLGMPFLLMIIFRCITKKGWLNSGFAPKFKGNMLYYTISILLFPFLIIILLKIAEMADAVYLFCPLKGKGSANLLYALLLSGLIKNIFEESVWRGFLTPKFAESGFPRLTNHIVTGLLWGLWHLPYLGFVLSYISENQSTLIPRFLMGTIAFSIIAGELRLQARSLLPVIIMHTIAGLAIGFAYSENHYVEFVDNQWLFSPGIEGGIMIILMTVAGSLLLLNSRGIRKK